MAKFVNLHTHSHYSLLDGLPKIPDLVKHAKSLGMDSLALTDHGNMHGAIEFYKNANKEGLRPIIGVEAYLAIEHRSRKQSKLDDSYFHLILLAENNEGYKNLMKLSSIAALEGFYYKPRIDKESLRRHSKGIIALTGCLAGEIPRQIQNDHNIVKARETLNEYLEIFGQDNVFLEIQHHPEIPEQIEVNDMIKELSQVSGIPRVVTLDCHYLLAEDAEAQDALLCVQSGKYVSDTNRLDMRGIDLSVRSPEEMSAIFADDIGVVEQSLKIAERCNVDIELGKFYFPDFEIPKNKTVEDHLREKTEEGLQIRYKDKEITAEVRERIEYELGVIAQKGYQTYFLIVADFVNWMREEKIITTTRGSAAGCMVSYCLGITNVDPIEYDLPFERFLNPYRPSAPDIDIDIADNRRGEVIKYVTEKYGADKVAQIITFGTMLARAAVRDVGRVLGIPYAKCDQIAKLVPPPKQGFPMPIEKALKTSPELQELYNTDPETRKIIDLVKKVQGVARHASVHAAGVVIAPTTLTDFTPLQHPPDGEGVVTQYDMHACEDVGLVKMDFLGIRNLSILGNAVEIVAKKHNVNIDLENIPLDDKKTFELLARGDTVGLFQVNGSGMTAYLKELKPTTIFDIMAMIALYRPGPMDVIPEYIRRKNDPSLVKYIDPRMSKFLSKSFGLIVYQDDLLSCALKLAGYNWEEADKFRKAVGKKIPAEMAAQKEKFTKGIIENGQTEQFAEKLWQLFEPFQAYGFNKAHAASYAQITYQTAYMKANYPAEYMAALLTAESHVLEKVAEGVEECKRMGISVLPPDINQSFKMFSVLDDKNIRWALTAVKNVGHDVVAAIIRERKENGEYTSFQNFVARLPNKNLNRKSLESLIKCGAFDSLGERNLLLNNLEAVLEATRAARRNLVEGQNSLFAGNEKNTNSGQLNSFAFLPTEAAEQDQLLLWEKELLGLYITAHPLDSVKPLLEKLTPIKELESLRENQLVAFGGSISKSHKITTRKGEPMAFLTIEDLTGNVECVCFPRLYTSSRELIDSNELLLLQGKISDKDGDTKILLDEISPLNDETVNNLKISPLKRSQPNGETKRIKIKLPQNAQAEHLQKLKEIFAQFPGSAQVILQFQQQDQERQLVTEFKVKPSSDFKAEIAKALKT